MATSDSKPILAKRLRELRLAFHYTQKQVAEYCGIACSTYSAYEIGRAAPSWDIMCKLCTLFRVQADYLLGRTDELSFFIGDLSKEQQIKVEQLIKEYLKEIENRISGT